MSRHLTIGEEIKPSELKNKLVDTRAFIRWDRCSVGQSFGGWTGVKLARQVAV